MIARAKASSTFCIFPFHHLATKTDGTIKLCCRSGPVGNIRSGSVTETWNGENYRRVRRQLLNGERPPECHSCFQMEDVGARSMRQRALSETFESRWVKWGRSVGECDSDGSMRTLPRSLELKISNLCNLKCRMCSPVDSTMWAKDWPAVKHLMRAHNGSTYRTAEAAGLERHPVLATFDDSPAWWEEFELMIDHLDLIEFAGGEPLIDPIHYKILDKLRRRAPHIHLAYSTNLTRLDFRGREVIDSWKEFSGVDVYASVDGIFEVYDYIRSGARFQDVDANLERLRTSPDVPLKELAIACTLQVYNAFQVPQIADYFLRRQIQFHTHRVSHPEFLSVQVLPRDLKTELTAETEAWLAGRQPLNDYEERHLPRIRKHLIDHLNYMNGHDQSHLLPALAEFTEKMDQIRVTDAANLDRRLGALLNGVTKNRQTTANVIAEKFTVNNTIVPR